MTTENNAAQPGENLLDYAMHIAHERELDVTGHKHDSDGAVRRFKAAVDRALLSKLRAEGVQAGDEPTQDVNLPWLRAYMHHQIASDRWVVTADQARGFARVAVLADRQARAALASAPVAEPEDTREDFDIWCKKHGYASSGSINMLWSAWREALKHASAPVAGEALQVASRAMQMIRRSKLDPFERQQHDKLVQDFAALHERPVAAPQASEADFADAYEGAREDLAIWKRRALEAENLLRVERKTARRLIAELNAANGPTHMGEPAPQADKDGGDCAKGAGDE